MSSYEYGYLLDEKTKVVIKATRVPKDEDFKKGLKFSVSLLHLRKDEWTCVARIDNHRHKGKRGLCHIHRESDEREEYKDLTLKEAEETINKISKNLSHE